MVGKIQRTLRKLAGDFCQDIKCYSFSLAALRFLTTFFQIIRQKRLLTFLQRKKDQYVLNYLKSEFSEIFRNYSERPNHEDNVLESGKENLPVWMCWLDGIENAPPLVQQCFRSIKKHAGKHPVTIITWENYFQYVDIPDYVIQKVQEGKIGFAHFSDILRVALIARYGGLWLDATIYCTGELPDEYFDTAFFTCKSPEQEIGCVSKNRWTTFCLGGRKNSPVFCCLRDFFFSYWEKENQAIDYLFFDDAIEVARECVPMIEQLINQVAINNIQRDRLIARFADPWRPGCVDDLLQGDTILFKLGYREAVYLKELTNSGQETVYWAFLHNFYLEDK